MRLGTWVGVSQWQGADLGRGICSIRVPLPSGSGQRASPLSLGIWLSHRHAWRKASSRWVNSEAPQGGRETSLPSPAAGGSWTAGGSQSAELPAWLEVGEAEALAGWAAGGRLPGSFLPPQVCRAVWPGLLLGAGRRGTWGVPHPGDICDRPDLSGAVFTHPGWVELGVDLAPRAGGTPQRRPLCRRAIDCDYRSARRGAMAYSAGLLICLLIFEIYKKVERK